MDKLTIPNYIKIYLQDNIPTVKRKTSIKLDIQDFETKRVYIEKDDINYTVELEQNSSMVKYNFYKLPFFSRYNEFDLYTTNQSDNIKAYTIPYDSKNKIWPIYPQYFIEQTITLNKSNSGTPDNLIPNSNLLYRPHFYECCKSKSITKLPYPNKANGHVKDLKIYKINKSKGKEYELKHIYNIPSYNWSIHDGKLSGSVPIIDFKDDLNKGIHYYLVTSDGFCAIYKFIGY